MGFALNRWTMDKVEIASDRMISVDEIKGLMGISTSTVWRLIAYKGFPKPFALGTQVRRWWLSDVHQWIQMQPRVASDRG